MIKRSLLLSMLMAVALVSTAQRFNPRWMQDVWEANWIAPAGAPAHEYGIHYLRKDIDLPSKPASLKVLVSGDNHYSLYVNDAWVGIGPTRSDLNYWRFEVIDLAPYLKQGKNVIAATVWNEGEHRPEGQISYRTGFILQADDTAYRVFNTNGSWKGMSSKAYSPIPGIAYPAYYVAGPGERFMVNENDARWKSSDFSVNNWPAAVSVQWRGGTPKGIADINPWMLVPDPLPPIAREAPSFPMIRKITGGNASPNWPGDGSSIQIPANKKVDIILDETHLTNAYVNLKAMHGKGSVIAIRYAEALYDTTKGSTWSMYKGNRDDINGKVLLGRKDSLFLTNGGELDYQTLSFRTFRYIWISVTTGEEALELKSISSRFTGYPFELKASFNADNEYALPIFNVGWRTARLCAVDTYMDCPYYEQLQYIGDTRIQALVSLYNSGDDRLVRNAIEQMDQSRMAEGLTLSRHPSFSPQQIPTFSLWYIGMLYDYYKYRGDAQFIKDKLQGMRNVLWYFNKFQQADGRLKGVPYWMFTDWVEERKGWGGGTGPYSKNGSSAILDMQLLWAYQLAAYLETQLGMQAYAVQYGQEANRLKAAIQNKYWVASKQLYADTEEKDLFSQHTNTLAILTGMTNAATTPKIADRLERNDTLLAPASIYFRYYVHQALVKAGRGDHYFSWLDKWKENIQKGLTTWAEMSEVDYSRSDCHAWGASPNIEFFRTILGIDSDAPGFSKVKITPHLGTLTDVKGSMPHPYGMIHAKYKKTGEKWTATIELPKGLTGVLVWRGRVVVLRDGENVIKN